VAGGTGANAETLTLDGKRRRIDPKRLLPGLPALPAFAAIAIYLAMLPAAITAANYSKDSGDFLTAALTGGVPHPSGYPTYILLLKLFLGLPIGSNYFKGSLLSAVAAGLGVFFLAYLMAHRQKFTPAGIVGAVASGTAVAFAPLFWSQAVVVEVQALQAFFVVLALWWVTLLEEEGYSRSKKIGVVGLAWGFGLAVGNHLTILFLAPLVLVAARKASRNGLGIRWIAGQGIAFLAGCGVYLYLPFAAQHYPPVNWGNPQTMAGFWWTVSGAEYHGMLLGVPTAQLLNRLGNLGIQLINQFTVTGLLTAGAGVWWNRSRSNLFGWGIGWVFAVFSLFYLTYSSTDAVVYLIGAWIAVSIWIGNGAAAVWGKKNWRAPLGTLAGIAILAALIGRIPQGWVEVDPRRDTVTSNYLDIVLKRAPENALVLTAADADTFPLWYGVFGNGLRKDLKVIVISLTQFEWYQETLRHTYLDLIYPPAGSDMEVWDRLGSLNPGRPVCSSELVGGNLDKIKMTCDGNEILNLDFSEKGN